MKYQIINARVIQQSANVVPGKPRLYRWSQILLQLRYEINAILQHVYVAKSQNRTLDITSKHDGPL